MPIDPISSLDRGAVGPASPKGAVPVMQVRLEVVAPNANVRRVLLRRDTVIGRSRECNLRIASTQVSRRHCCIKIREETVVICDLGSANGTFVDGRRIPAGRDIPLAAGSQLSIGPVGFVVRYENDPAPAPPPGSTVELPVYDDGKGAKASGSEIPVDADSGGPEAHVLLDSDSGSPPPDDAASPDLGRLSLEEVSQSAQDSVPPESTDAPETGAERSRRGGGLRALWGRFLKRKPKAGSGEEAVADEASAVGEEASAPVSEPAVPSPDADIGVPSVPTDTGLNLPVATAGEKPPLAPLDEQEEEPRPVDEDALRRFLEGLDES